MDSPKLAGTDVDFAVAKAAIRQVRKDLMTKLFAAAMVENDPHKRDALLARLGELTRRRRDDL